MVNSLSDPQSGATLLTIFASLAITLAAVGLYSVVSFSVAQRNTEIAIRMAIGAQRGNVAGMIFRSTFAVSATGIVVGLLGSFAFRNVLAFYEQGWQPGDPVTLHRWLRCYSWWGYWQPWRLRGERSPSHLTMHCETSRQFAAFILRAWNSLQNAAQSAC